MSTGGVAQRIIRFAIACVGHLPGGLAIAGVLACGFFGAISGSTVATVVAIGGFMIPALLKHNYDEKFSVGIMTTAPILGVIIPPSIAMILYAMVSNDPLEALFLTGFIAMAAITFLVVMFRAALEAELGEALAALFDLYAEPTARLVRQIGPLPEWERVDAQYRQVLDGR